MNYPLDRQSTVDAAPGPTVSGTAIRPGDVLAGPDGDRVVVHTDRNAVGLFDPATRTRGPTTLDGEWSVRERSLGVGTTLGPDGDRQYLAVATAGTEGCRLRWGSTPLGGTTVQLSGDAVRAPTPAALRARIDDGAVALSATLGERWPPLSATLNERIATVARARWEGATETGSPLRATGVRIPTGEASGTVDVDGRPFAPGDRFVTVPGAAPFAADREALAAGRCVVVLSEEWVYELPACRRELATEADLRSLLEMATAEGLVCRLLERDCHVEAVGDERIHSLHVYRTEGQRSGVLLASDSRPTAAPALEHPVALSCQRFDGLDGVVETLRQPQTVAGIDTDPPPELRRRCRQMADRLAGGGGS